MPRLLLLYGSNTGNTEYAARSIAQAFANHHLTLSIQNVAKAKAEAVIGQDLLILGSSTWGDMVNGRYKEGQLQDQMAVYLNQLSRPKLAKTPVAIFGLGDSQYQYFCGAAVQLQKFVSQAGAHLVSEPLYIDGYPQLQPERITEWSSQVVQSWQEHQFIQN